MAQYADDFWSIAFLPNEGIGFHDEQEDDVYEDAYHSIKNFTIPAPEASCEPLTIRLCMNNNEGVLEDVSGIPWDASLLLAGYLFGTYEGRRLCIDACSSGNTNLTEHCDNAMTNNCGGILELGSGLGTTGIAAIAAIMNCSEIKDCNKRIVLTDRDDEAILTRLKRNVDTNIAEMQSRKGYNPYLSEISVKSCDWIEVSNHRQKTVIDDTHHNFPRGPFNLILGSALVYIPEHAAACADTLYYYLSDDCIKGETSVKRQAVIVQIPDRSGFNTHFLPRCDELGLVVVSKPFDGELINRLDAGLNKRIASVTDYRMFLITKNT